ncbi:MAG: Uncharacterized protein G01um101472_3 [Parcubacteria group bacterium Gr01-1014_72]|nr:MAG: Uncharacterized protein G01um101472_3 [Parcubacteria group bacterium Gr01-1014_72]
MNANDTNIKVHDANIRMSANETNKPVGKIIYPEISYIITGICFDAHNSLGRFAREKQYGDEIEKGLIGRKIPYVREYRVGEMGNIIDFLIEEKIILEIKAKPLILKEDFHQTQRYLQHLNKKLALLVNFRNRYLKPIRIIQIEKAAHKRFGVEANT